MISDKKSVQQLVGICYEMGIRHIIISPGSRNAPLTISFSGFGKFQLYSIVDERSAAFFALGISQQTGVAAALVCTSGSAVLNYAPAIVEAYYQQVPLLVLTADRPPHRIDVGDGQTMRQTDVYHNYIRWSTSIEPNDKSTNDTANKIIRAIRFTQVPLPGPVHINISLDDPLYRSVPLPLSPPEISTVMAAPPSPSPLPEQDISAALDRLPPAPKVMLLIGMMPPSEQWTKSIYDFMRQCPNTVVLSETTANVYHPGIIAQIDRTLQGIPPSSSSDYIPDLLITMGHSIISKKIKQWFRSNTLSAHWHVDAHGHFPDIFHQLSTKIPVSPPYFLRQFPDIIGDQAYFDRWNTLVLDTARRHENFLQQAPFTDLTAYHFILNLLRPNTVLQMGNSTVVRYCQLFPNRRDILYFSNRGVSGIEGCTSTALGAATVIEGPVVLLIGDISFGYDANAFWHSHLPANIKIIAFNNGGGNIFRFIEGPDQTDVLDTLFVTPRPHTVKRLAQRFNLPYQKVKSLDMLTEILPHFLSPDQSGPAVLEITTDGQRDARVLRQYFKALQPQ